MSTFAERISLEQLIALNDEMVALSRAGIPLGHGLKLVGSDIRGRQGEVMQRLGNRLDAGESLVDVVRGMEAVPPTYAAIVEAGIRSNNLPQALADVSRSARVLSQLKQTYLLGLIPLLVTTTFAYVLALYMYFQVVPQVSVMLQEFRVPGMEALHRAAGWATSTPGWYGIVPPLLIVPIGYLLLFRLPEQGATRRAKRGLPNLGRLRSMHRQAVMVETICILLENDVPLDEAFDLSAECTGDKNLIAAANSLTTRLRAGSSPAALQNETADFQPISAVVLWTLFSAQSLPQATKALRRIAVHLRHEAERMARAWAVFAPIILSAILAGGISLAFALFVFLPLLRTITHIAAPL